MSKVLELEEFQTDNWNITKKSRSLVFAMKNDIRNGINTNRGNFKARALGFKRLSEIKDVPWQNI